MVGNGPELGIILGAPPPHDRGEYFGQAEPHRAHPPAGTRANEPGSSPLTGRTTMWVVAKWPQLHRFAVGPADPELSGIERTHPRGPK
jgi:hypothetical protein